MKITIATILATSCMFLSGVPHAEAAFPGSNGRIAYYRLTPSLSQIYTIRPDGTGIKMLTHRGNNITPDWSADGGKIAYIRVPAHGPAAIMSMNANGTGKTVIRDTFPRRFRSPEEPSWSPDSSQLAFCGFGNAGERVFTLNANGTGLKKISGQHNDCDPQWSPSGTQLVVGTDRANGTPHVVTMNVDGTGRDSIAKGVQPSWSPDNSHVTYVTCCTGRSNIATVASDGTGFTLVTDTPRRFEFTPAYSPDGTEIVFSRTQKKAVLSPDDLWTIHTDGTSAVRITTTKDRDEFDPDWQPR